MTANELFTIGNIFWVLLLIAITLVALLARQK